MILLDEEDPPPSKFDIVAGPTTVRLPDSATVASSRASSLLPDYETSQAQNFSKFDRHRLRKKVVNYRVDSRFWRATLYALAVYVALTVVVGVPIIVMKTKKSPPPSPPPPRSLWEGPPLTSGGMNGSKGLFTMDSNCEWKSKHDDDDGLHFSAVTYHSFSSIDRLQVQSNVSSLPDQSRGIYGNLTVNINSNSSVSTTSVVLSLTASSYSLLQRTQACFCDNGTDGGLTIYVPDNRLWNDSLLFSIDILFPKSRSNHVKDFATSLPVFSQHFGDLSSMNFSTFSIQGAQGDVSFKSLTAQLLSVKNSFAGISGSFRVSGSINLDNIEGPISTNVTLVRAAGQDPPIFELDTGNSPLDANFLIVSPSPSSKSNGHFPQCISGQAKTFNAPLSLTVSYSTSTDAGVPIDLTVLNNQADTNVTMDSKFYGWFDIQTKLADVQLITSTSTDQDESGNPQVIIDQKTSTRYRGWVGLGKRPSHWDSGQGQVQVVSSLSPVRLQLGSDVS